MSVNLHGIHKEDNVESCIKQKGKLISLNNADRISISRIYHCDGLLLCITDDINSRLVVWNPYCGQTRWINPRNSYHERDNYALEYEMKNNANRSYKILRFLDTYQVMSDDMSVVEHRTRICEFEIYSFESNSWKIIEVTPPDCSISFCQRGVSLKGNTYWFSEEETEDNRQFGEEDEIPSFLLCFDFTTERFGSCLPLPFHPQVNDTVVLSTVGEEQLAVLYQRWTIMWRGIWISDKIESNAVSWSELFLQVGRIRELEVSSTSFFVDEEEKVAVIFDKGKCRYNPTRNIANIV